MTSPSMTIVGGEEWARELFAQALDKRGDHSAARGVRNGSIELGCMAVIDAMLAFAAEASGIGVLDEARIIEIANRAVDENLNEDGTAKFGTAQGFACAQSALRLAASISSREAEENALAELHAIVDGIDLDELSDDKGWWQTSTGVEFGAGVLAKLEDLVRRLVAK